MGSQLIRSDRPPVLMIVERLRWQQRMLDGHQSLILTDRLPADPALPMVLLARRIRALADQRLITRQCGAPAPRPHCGPDSKQDAQTTSWCALTGEDRTVNESRPTIPALLERSVREFGDHTYVVTPTDRLTYEEAERRSARMARRLLRRGVGKGSRVGLFFTNGVDWVVWWLAASRIGALVVPLSTLYTPAEIAKVLRLSDIGTLVSPRRVLDIDVAQRFEAALPELSDQSDERLALTAAPYLRSIVIVGDADPGWARRAGTRRTQACQRRS